MTETVKLKGPEKKMPSGSRPGIHCADCFQRFSPLDYSNPASALRAHHANGKCPGRRE